ncbi:MAG: hypothetical protein WDZ84_13870 [Rhodovibrionaceae bacterium]
MPADSRLHSLVTVQPPQPGEDAARGKDAAENARPLPAREDRCYMTSETQVLRLQSAIATALAPRMTEMLRRDASGETRKAVADFFELYAKKPILNNKGGSLFNDSLSLYVTMKLLRPDFILESGTYRGNSSWLFRQACPQAAIQTHDVDHGQLAHRAEDIVYIEGDWMDSPLPDFDPARAVAFFDDHINHALRLRQAHDRGFRRALFDDNFPAHNLYATGGQPLPSLAMLMDERLEPGETFAWVRHGKRYSYTFEVEHTQGARERIARYLPLPDLTAVTRYSPQSGLTFVELLE